MRRDMDARFERWGDWWAGHIDKSVIGYPSMTPEARLTCSPGHSGKAATICPDVMMPKGVSEVDKVVHRMTVRWRRLVIARYIERKTLTYKEYREMDRIHHYMHGCLQFM